MKKRWRKFNFVEWRSDADLRRCSREARSLWLDVVGLIYDAEDEGRLSIKGRAPTDKELAEILGDDPRTVRRLMGELQAAGVFDVEQNFVVSRRISREELQAKTSQEYGKRGGNPSLKNKDEAENRVNPVNQKPDTRSQIPEKIEANASSAPLIATPEPAPKKTRRREAPKVEAHFMADDWWPSEADFEWAADPKNTHGIQLTREESENETHQCKRWFLDKRDAGNPVGKRPGHTRSWQTWICKSAPEILRARPRTPVSAFAGRANGTSQFAPKISQHDAFALAALKASGARGDAGRQPDHGNDAGTLFGPAGVEILDFGDDRGAEARRAGGNREPASAIVRPLSAAGGR